MIFTPARQRGHEILDDPSLDPALAERSLRDVALANRFFGGRRAIVRELRGILRDTCAAANASMPTGSSAVRREMTLLDVGTGIGDIPAAASRVAEREGVRLHTVGLELAPSLARAARARCSATLAADAMALPFADRSIDIITCSQVLHHFDDVPAARLLRECTRVARVAVIIGDLRRSWLAAAGLWVSSFALGFHPVSRHDGIVSILRGYTREELLTLTARATGATPRVSHALGWRVTATWAPPRSHAASEPAAPVRSYATVGA